MENRNSVNNSGIGILCSKNSNERLAVPAVAGLLVFAVADIGVLWPIWFVADMTAPRSHQWWNFMFTDILQNVTDYHTVFNLVRSQQRAQHARQIQ